MHPPGSVRDAIVEHLRKTGKASPAAEAQAAMKAKPGKIPVSSVRSSLRLNTPERFERTGHGRHKLAKCAR